MNTWSLGIDVGGTFTDVVLTDESGNSRTTKTPSTRDQSDGVLAGIEKVALEAGTTGDSVLADCGVIVHGTTVATNALLPISRRESWAFDDRRFPRRAGIPPFLQGSTFDPRLRRLTRSARARSGLGFRNACRRPAKF